MAVDAKLLEILACPNCRGDVEYREDDQIIECVGQCRFKYPVREGIPVMLIDEAIKPEDAGA